MAKRKVPKSKRKFSGKTFYRYNAYLKRWPQGARKARSLAKRDAQSLRKMGIRARVIETDEHATVYGSKRSYTWR